MWTLTYLGVEKSFADLGLINCHRTLVSQGIDSVTFDLALDLDKPEPYPYRAEIIIKRNRVEHDDSTNLLRRKYYTGGEVFFVGYVGAPPRKIRHDSEMLSYTLDGPWWYLENLVYQQPWFIVQDPANPANSKKGGLQSHVFLNKGINGAQLKTDWQIWDAVNYAIEAGAPIQIPTLYAEGNPPTSGYAIVNPGDPEENTFIDGPNNALAHLPSISVPFDEGTDLTCAEVIKRQLRWTPDALTWFDYSTSPPTFCCARRSDMVTTTVDLYDKDRIFEQIDITPRRDLRVPAVVLKFERVDDHSGQQFLMVNTRTYPDLGSYENGLPIGAGADQRDTTEQKTAYQNLVAENQRQFAALVSTIDLKGASISSLSSPIITEKIETDSINWWKKKVPVFKSDRIKNLQIFDVVRLLPGANPDGSPIVAHGYENELVEGQIADWMDPLATNSERETINYKYKYTRIDENGTVMSEVPEMVGDYSCVSTKMGSGNYNMVETIEFGEPIPEGLAKELYLATNTVHYQGSIVITEEELGCSIRPGMKLNITSGNIEWATMSALVQSVSESVDNGQTRLQLGPAAHLGPTDLIELLRINRLRHIWTNPASRTSGQAAATNKMELAKRFADMNTNMVAERFHRLRLLKQDFSIDFDAIDKRRIFLEGGEGGKKQVNQITQGQILMQNGALAPIQHPRIAQGDLPTGQTLIEPNLVSIVGPEYTGELIDGSLDLRGDGSAMRCFLDPRDLVGEGVKDDGQPGDPKFRVLRARPFIVCVNGTKMRAFIAMTKPEPI